MKKIIFSILMAAAVIACTDHRTGQNKTTEQDKSNKAVVYQVFTRLFGNTNDHNKPWGSITENGVGKFNDFSDKALDEIKDMGVTHIWYTGVPHHAIGTDYSQFGISNDDPDVVKGRAGSPYAVKDYYQVNPDMAVDVSKRMEEFESLINRTHKHGMRVIIDIVPNHVARHYQGLNNPKGVKDFGASDDTSLEYSKNNNFYYIPGKAFLVPELKDGYEPLGGEKHPLSDGTFNENPAKWTGNGSRLAQPSADDWYETVKINYGIRPDGEFDFVVLPDSYKDKSWQEHYAFWQGKEMPDSWIKFRDIAFFWLDKGVDGFRFDMAEMVPVEFWSFLNSSIKNKNSETFLLAEVYQPNLYRDYIHKGKMDYLYDKVDLYDTLKHIMQGHGSTDYIAAIQHKLADIEHHLIHFLENHDEQRIASPQFAGDAKKGMPAMVVSATLSTSPTMLYFGQEVGEPGAEDAGFGASSRTSIFDYVGVPHHQRWMNNGKFDGGQLSDDEKELRLFYQTLLKFTSASEALMGDYADIHAFNRSHTEFYGDKVYSFVRWSENEKLLVIANFSAKDSFNFDLKIPADIITKMNIAEGSHPVLDILSDEKSNVLKVEEGLGTINITMKPLQSYVFQVK